MEDWMKVKLDYLNLAVDEAIKVRKDWLDEMMPKVAKYKIGDDLYNLETGAFLGTVSKLYRYSPSQLYDTSLHCYYEYETSPRCFDNTSRQSGVMIGLKSECKIWPK